ncbi:MAG: hypothetical protein ACKVS9_02390 [Phycisphaerae bacterium]
MINFARLTGIAVIALAFAPAAVGQVFSIDWHTIDGGGGTSLGGLFEVSGTIGQPDAGVLTGGSFELSGGFWYAPTFCDEDLNRDGQINLTDLSILLANFGLGGATPAQGDIDRSGTVDLVDLSRLLSLFGTPCP